MSCLQYLGKAEPRHNRLVLRSTVSFSRRHIKYCFSIISQIAFFLAHFYAIPHNLRYEHMLGACLYLTLSLHQLLQLTIKFWLNLETSGEQFCTLTVK